jgi:hypothetical protein
MNRSIELASMAIVMFLGVLVILVIIENWMDQ